MYNIDETGRYRTQRWICPVIRGESRGIKWGEMYVIDNNMYEKVSCTLHSISGYGTYIFATPREETSKSHESSAVQHLKFGTPLPGLFNSYSFIRCDIPYKRIGLSASGIVSYTVAN